MVDVSIKLNPQVQANFEKALNEALIYNKRSVSEICNSTLFFVVRNAINGTAASTKGKIRNDLLTASQVAPRAPLAAILVNRNKGYAAEPGLYGAEMRQAVEAFIKRRGQSANYIRSRWIPANKDLAGMKFYKGGAKRLPSGLKLRGSPAGGAKPASDNWKTSGYIFATIEKLKGADGAGVLLNKGLELAVKQETESKLQYILNKKVEEGIVRLNRS